MSNSDRAGDVPLVAVQLAIELVGREPQQKSVTTLLEEARSGRSGVLAVVGEPGMGKSALLNQAAELAAGMTLLRARGVESEAQIPFAGLSELLLPALRQLDRIPAQQARALQGALALVPARAEDRFAVGAATLSLLSAFAEQRPVLVVIDDAHWLDGSSADALSFAFRRLLADPIAVLLAVRSGEPSLLDRSDLPRTHLDGIDVRAASTLVSKTAGDVPESLIGRLHRHTGGNPLALIEAARQIDRFRHDAPIDLPLPLVTRVSEVYAARIRSLEQRCRRVLLLAAASDTGELATISRAAAVINLGIADMQAAEDNRLVELDQGRVEFRHPLVRSAVYADATAQERREAHKLLAAALPDADADRRAWHLAQASAGPDEAASSALEQSALRGRERNAYDVASRTFERAAQLATDDSRRAQLLYQAAESSWTAGDGARTRVLLDQADRQSPCDNLAIAIQHLKGRVAARLGPVSDGLSILLTAAGRASSSDSEQAVVMLAESVNAAFYAGDTDAMRAAADQLATLEPRLATNQARFFAVMAQGMALTFTSRSQKGASLLRRGVELATHEMDNVDDPTWLTWAAMGRLWLRESKAGRAIIDRATDFARLRTSIGVLPYLLSHIAIDYASTNRWDEAEAAFHEAISLAGETGQRTDQAAALSRLAWLEARRGNEQSCLEHAAEAARLAAELDLKLVRLWALAALGDLHMVAGRTEEALAQLTRMKMLLDGITDVDMSPAPELVELHLRTGDVDLAASLAAEYQDQASLKGQPWALGRAARSRGLLAEDEDIDEVFSESLEALDRTPDLFESARSHLAYGSRLRRSQQRARSRPHLQAAIDIFDDLGASPWAEMARSELAATGVTARRRDDSTRHQLTPQELQIALRLAGGQTTKQAAAALFLSPKTVEYHLRSVYRKLGCNTREELSRALNVDAAPS